MTRRAMSRWLLCGCIAMLAVGRPPATAPALAADPETTPAPGKAFLPLGLTAIDLRHVPVPATARPAPASPTATPPPEATRSPTTAPSATDAPTPTPSGPDIATAHYDLHVEGSDAADVGRMLEALYADLAAFFGSQPAGRLRGRVYATLEAMQAGLAADGETYHGGGGYYSPATRAFYMFRQPSDYFTRQLILHEATHQFHFLVATGNTAPAGGWYVEGIAEHFGMHNWDGTQLASGVVPAISLEDYPAQALAHFDSHGGNLADLIADGPGWDRPDGWGLVGFLVDRRAPAYRDLFARLDRRESPAAAWAAALGPVTSQVAAEYRAWLVGHQQPWHEVWRAWQERGGVLEGRSDVVGIAVLQVTPPRLAAELVPVAGPTAAGLVFGFQSADDFYLLQLRANRDVWVLRRSAGQWQFLASRHAAPIPGHDVVALEIRGDEVTPSVNGVALDGLPAPGRVGLNVEGGTMHFRVTAAP